MIRAVTLGLVSFFLFGFVPLEAEDSTTGKGEASTFPQYTLTAKDRQNFNWELKEMKRLSRHGSDSVKVPDFDPERVDKLWEVYLECVKEVEPLNLEFVEKAAEAIDLDEKEIISGPGFASWREKMDPKGWLRPGVIDPMARYQFIADAEKVLTQKGERLSNSEKSKVKKLWARREKEVTDIIRDFAGDISKNIRFSRTKARQYLLKNYLD